MYPSVDMAWVSSDGVTWEHNPLNTRDIGLDARQGIKPGPYRYKVEVQAAPGQWVTVIDRSKSTEDLLIDYRECPPTKGGAARLVIVGAPAGVTPGVAEFTVFGEASKR
jgi:hypothetical protein